MSTRSPKPSRAVPATPGGRKGPGGDDTDRSRSAGDGSRALAYDHTDVGGPPAVGARRPPPATRPPPAVDAADPYLGRVIADRYRVLRKLGEGGMGVVYLAEHVVIEKKVALKILSEDLARKKDLVARFLQEARAATKIGHENIVDVTDYAQVDAGTVFIAMEYLDGTDLAAVIREHGPLPFARVLHIVTQVCRALEAAHGKGIIHRDMKPENIFLIERGGRADFVKILDFGIAKMNALDEPGGPLTRTGMIFGTPEYMSPEQARGERPDHRVDIYAVGCIVYELLTGGVPFHAETFMGVLTKQLFEPPVPPSQRAPGAQISSALEAVILRALSKNRVDRFASMRDFAMALSACDGGDLTTFWEQDRSGNDRPVSHGHAGIATTLAGAPAPSRFQTTMTGPAAVSRTARWVLLGIAFGAALAIALWPRGRPAPVEPQPLPAQPVAAAPVAPVVDAPSKLDSEPSPGGERRGPEEDPETLRHLGHIGRTPSSMPDPNRSVEAKLVPVKRSLAPPARRPVSAPGAATRAPEREKEVTPAATPAPTATPAQGPDKTTAPTPRRPPDLIDPYTRPGAH